MKNYHNSQNGKLLWLSHAALQFFSVKKKIHKPEMLVLSQSLLSNKNGRCSTSFKMNSWAADSSSLSFQPLTVVKDLTVFVSLKSHATQLKNLLFAYCFCTCCIQICCNSKSWYTGTLGVKVGDYFLVFMKHRCWSKHY